MIAVVKSYGRVCNGLVLGEIEVVAGCNFLAKRAQEISAKEARRLVDHVALMPEVRFAGGRL